MKPETFHEQPSATHPEVAFFEPEGDHYTFCNCENVEQLTPYESDDNDHCVPPAPSEERCYESKHSDHDTHLENEQQAEEILKNVKRRLAAQQKKRPCNPYLQRTRTCQIALYRNPQDTTPIDSMKTESVRGITWRSLLAVMGAVIGGSIATYQIIKAIAKKDLQNND